MKKNIREMTDHPAIARLKNDDGDWKDPNIVGTEVFDEQVIEYFAKDLQHLSSGNNEPDREPLAIVLWLGIDNPINSPYVRIVSASERGLWMDGETSGRIGSPTVLVPWTSIFAIHIHSEKTVKSTPTD